MSSVASQFHGRLYAQEGGNNSDDVRQDLHRIFLNEMPPTDQMDFLQTLIEKYPEDANSLIRMRRSSETAFGKMKQRSQTMNAGRRPTKTKQPKLPL